MARHFYNKEIFAITDEVLAALQQSAHDYNPTSIDECC